MSELGVALPDSLLMEDRDLRDKTLKLGQIARAASIFCVRRIIIFPDPMGEGGKDNILIRDVLQYIETPQYLRKRLYPLKPHLKFAGLLPPLKIPSHKREAVLRDGEFREAFIELKGRDERVAFVGTPNPIKYTGKAKPGSRQTVRIRIESGVAKAIDASRSEINEYWGYSVKMVTDLFQYIERYNLKVATSRLGTPITHIWENLCLKLGSSPTCVVVFGSPKRGLFEMFQNQDMTRFDFVLNVVPGQGVETVRTEEAVFLSLQAITLCSSLSKKQR